MTSAWPYPLHMESWQWLYLALIAMAGLRLLGIAISSMESHHGLPTWLLVPAALGIVLMHPYCWIATFAFHVVLLGSAPIGASIIACIATIGSVFLIGSALLQWLGARVLL